MELRHLRYFVTVAEDLNYRRAASRLHVSQPALSKQIKDLEAELGVRLLDRNTVSVRLTDAGRVLVAEAKGILARVGDTLGLVRGAVHGRSGQLTVGNIAAISASFMPATLTAFRQRYPDVEVTLREYSSAEQVAALVAGDIQIGFTLNKHQAMPASLERFLVLTSPLRAVVGLGHRLARSPRVGLADVARERLLALANPRAGNRHRELIQEVLAARRLGGEAPKLVDGFDSLLASVASSQGVTLLPELANAWRAAGVTFRPLRDRGPDLSLELWAFWRKGESSRLAHNFIQVLREMRR
ncbi:MAG: LysR family transcriptional regulator [Verrucomicrobia bacterium]|nr:LysR family transcriptional regulator [Verrucomicrobiota bacterium]